jgi:3-oxoacyl-(acyl-carrier-protein) synthase
MNREDENISRLVKLADDSNKPGKAFADSLINDALGELNRLKTAKRQEITNVSWREKTMGWAAMFAAACAAGLTFVASAVLQINFFLQTVVIVTAVFNWLAYLGGHIL